MKKLSSLVLAAAAVFSFSISAAQAQQTVKFVNIQELSGPGATTGTYTTAGVTLAVKEINAAGGLLGRRIDLRTFDTQSNPGIAKALVAKAVDEDPYVILGPGYSGSVIISMTESRKAKIPNFTGAEAASLTQQGNDYIFRASISQAGSMPRAARYIVEGARAKSVAIVYINNEFGKGGRDVMIKELQARGINIAEDISVEQGQLDFSSVVLRIKRSGADVLFPYLNEEEGARLLRELHKQSFDKPIIGESTIANQKVIELAGEAANGVRAHVGLAAGAGSVNPRIRGFVARFEKEHGYKPDHNAFKGYLMVWVVKAVTDKVGRFDRAAFTRAMKNVRLSSKDEPGLLMDVRYDDKGDLDRESFLVEVQDGKDVVVEVLPPLNP